ncbi:MAG: TetR family transcriptional regulator, partial [Paenibacillaceae bacterium]
IYREFEHFLKGLSALTDKEGKK